MTTTNKKLKGNGQKKTVQKVQKMQPSLQLLPLIMDNIPQAVFWKDRDLVYLGCNQAFADDAGFASPEEVVGKTDYDMPWKDQAELYRADDRLVLEKGGSKLNYEEPQTTPDGATIWLRTSKVPVCEGNQIVAVLGMYEDITEYKKAQDVTRGERERFQTILETVRVPTIISRLSDGLVLYANHAIAEVSQIHLDKLIGFKTINFFADPHDREVVLASLQRQGYINDFEVQFRRTDGSTYWALLSSRVINYEGVPCVLSTYVDISARKRLEEDLLLRDRALASSLTAVFIIDLDFKPLYANDAFIKMTGYTYEEAMQLAVTDLTGHPEGVKRIDAAMAAQGFFTGEEPVKRKDGSVFPTTFSTAFITNDQGQPVAIQSSFFDISQRKQAEAAVHESEERFRRFTEATSEGLVFHERGVIVDANPAGLAMFGLTQASDFIGRNLMEYVVPESRQLIMEKMQFQDVPPYEVQCVRADGTTFPVETSTRTYKHGDRVIRATSFRDITERKQAEEALRAHDEFSQKQSSVFAELARSETLYMGNLQTAFAEVTEAAARTLKVQRASIWYYNEDHSEIRCMDLFEEGKGHSEGIVLGKKDFPSYFKALEDEKVIAADNAHSHPATQEFSAAYLTPLGINSMLDAPIRLRGRVIGVICNEHVGPFRQWTTEEQSFASTIVDFVTVAVETQERKQAEAGLLLRDRALSSSINAVFISGLDNKTLYVNDAFIKMFGYSRAEAMNITPMNVAANPEDLKQGLAAIQSQGFWTGESIGKCKDGSLVPVVLTASLIRNDEGRPIAMQATFLDISERKQAEQALRDSEARYSAVITQAQDGIVIIQDNILQFVNKAMGSMLGYTAAEMENTPIINYIAPESRPLIVNRIKARLAGEEVPNIYEAKLQRKDGTIIDCELSAGVIEYRGRPADVGMIRDITERKQAQNLLQQSEANLLSALRVANMGHWEYDITAQIFTLNDQYYSLHGLTAHQVGGYQISLQRFAQEFVWPEDVAVVGQATQQAIETTDPDFHVQVEARILHADGKPRWVSVWFRVEKDVQGRTIKLHGVNQDITARKQLEQEIQTALERRGLQVQLSTQVSQSIATASSLEELYERVVTQIKEQFNYYHTQLLRYDAAQEAIVLVNGYGEIGAKMLAAGHRLPMGEGLIGASAATGQTILRSALENDPNWRPNPLLPETKGEIAVPIKMGETVLGVLDVQSSVADALDADDQLLLESLCGQIATAIESTRLRQEMAERLEEINRLYRAMSHEGWQAYRQTADVPAGFIFDQAGLRPVADQGLAEELFAHVPLTVPGGEVIGTLAVADDPEHPLTPEEEGFLRQVSEQLSLALESARLFEQTEEQRGQLNEAMGIAKLANWEYDVNRDRFLFNDHFYSIFHTTVEQVGGYEISSAEYAERFVHPDDRPMVGGEIGKALSSTDRHYNVQLEHRILYADGGVGHISVNVHIERDEQGRITRYYGANQDITDRKRAQEAIAKRATELETVATVSTAASTLLNPDQLLQSVVNLTKERFNLYHAHIYLSNPSRDALVLTAGAGEVGRQMLAEGWSIPVDHELSIVANAYRSQQSVVANDLHRDQTSRFLSNRLLPDTRSEIALPLSVGGTVLGVFDVQSDQPNFFSAEDVNIYTTLASQVAVALQNARLYVEQAALVTQLRELDKLKSSFLANMSHELRTPLNSILGFADVIIEEIDGPLTENMNNDLRLIQKNGQHLLHLINDVLDMAKIEAGRMNLNPETFTAYEVLEEVTSITSTLASEKNLALFIEEDSDQDVKIYADRTRLRQVMINLVNNAIKFTETGKISLHLASIPGARILIKVKDTGISIPPDKLEPIFQEFTQVDSSSTRKAGGTGLGLPISRRLVEMHGGRLWAESTGIPGEGSTFFVELPVEARITETIEKQAK